MNFLIIFRDWYNGTEPDKLITVFCTGSEEAAMAQATDMAEKVVRHHMGYGWEVKGVVLMETMA
jgi:hypothetical protein